MHRPYTTRSLLLSVLIAAGVWACVAGGCAFVGSTGITRGWDGPLLGERLWTYVLPASLVGAGLAAAGVAYQAILRNPLSDPYLLGVSSGASLAAYCWRMPAISAALGLGGIALGGAASGGASLGSTSLGSVSLNSASLGSASLGSMSFGGGVIAAAASQQAFAFAGALLAVTLVLGLAGARGRIEPVTAILVGVIVNALCGSVFLLLNTLFRDPPGSGGAMTFLIGDVQTNLTTGQLGFASGVIGLGWIALAAMAGQLGTLRLSAGEAQALGVRVHRVRWMGLIVASLMTAAAVAISGPIGFVGLICPHLARLFTGADPRRALPLATALGAALLALADALGRWLVSFDSVATLLPVGVITGLLGGPFFLLLLARRGATREGA